jgi:ATP-dependent helicase/nuclease subunit B
VLCVHAFAVETAANVRRHFLRWDRPLLPQAVGFLADGWRGDAPLDLSSLLVVVPTRQAGRRLREAIAAFASEKGQAAFPPRVVSPEGIAALGLGPEVASRIESLLTWADVVRGVDLDQYRSVFPVDPPARNFNWALRVAQDFSRLQATLAEGGLQFADVPPKAGHDFNEAERWRQLGELERLQAEKLARLGRRDLQAAKIQMARASAPLPGIRDVVLIATPDPLPLALNALTSHARVHPVNVLVFAPPAEQAAFDSWGRPRPEEWEHRELALHDFEQRVHLCADPSAQALRIAELAQHYRTPEGRLAVGIADAEVVAPLETELSRAELAVFNPEGRPRHRGALAQLLAALAGLAREPSFEAVETLARCPDILKFLQARLGAAFSAARWLADLDQLRARHLPADLGAALRHAERRGEYLKQSTVLETGGGEGGGRERAQDASGLPGTLLSGLRAIQELRDLLTSRDFAAATADALSIIFADRRLELSREPDIRFEEEATAWSEVLRECAAAAANFGELNAGEWWDLALRLFGAEMCTDEKPAGAIELQGWLELLWEDAPHLVVAGLNDGRVPEAVVGDSFLPESLRERLGLKTNAARFARDAYILQAIAASRQTMPTPSSRPGQQEKSRLDLLIGKRSAIGDPLRPSRLLLRCADTVLPQRIAFLFREPARVDPYFSWTRSWKLRPSQRSAPERIAVTAVRNYLQCPFRFYLRHVLRMEPVDAAKNELDARDFGTLCHAALEKMAGAPALRDCTDAHVLREALQQEYEHQIRIRYGENLALPLLIQLESGRQRLAKAAEVQARECAAGWLVEQVEWKFTLQISGLQISGKIDRIDRHRETGALRVLDYKTADTAANPATTHLRPLRPGEVVAEWARFDLETKPRVWADLQLPLYLQALAASGMVSSGQAFYAGYFNLPKAVGETGLAVWEPYTVELHAAALACASGACTAIRAGEFWPPNETVRSDYDDFESLFHHGAAASIAWKEAATP